MPQSEVPKTVSSPATAGGLILAGLVLGIAAGLGVGALLNTTAIPLVIGTFLGLVCGVAAVTIKFRDL